jgi:two-component system, OmpR family, sensor histidine kinase KdpD
MSRQLGDRIAVKATSRSKSLRSHSQRLQAAKSTDLLSRMVRYGGTILTLSLTTAVLVAVREDIGLLNMGLVYLVVIIGGTLFAGRLAGILASVLGFVLLNFFLVPPYLTFDVTGHNDLLALFVFLGVSVLISTLISGAREQAEHAQRRAEDVSRLYELSQTIIGAHRIEEVLTALARKVADVFDVRVCWLLLPDERGRLSVRAHCPQEAQLPSREEMSEAEWAFRHGKQREASGVPAPAVGNKGASESSIFVPLRAAHSIMGVLAVVGKAGNQSFASAELTMLATFADQAAVALERLSLLKEAERAEVLARTDELKSALMSAVSHDLRTPLASITASVTSLLEPDIDWDGETRRDFLQGIYEEAQRLNMLVGNLLDMSRIEGGALHPEKDWYSLGEVIGAVAQRLEPQTSDHPLKVDIEALMPLLLLDFSQIEQVLTNILENAIKYTPAGTHITLRARQEGANIAVSVADTGDGVAEEHIPHLFDKFYRVPYDRTNVRDSGRKKGTGLGLAISKGLVEAHGGHIRAMNQPGGGLQVTFTLPLVQASPALNRNDEPAVHAEPRNA